MSLILKITRTGTMINLPMFGGGYTFAGKIDSALPERDLCKNYFEFDETSDSLIVEAISNDLEPDESRKRIYRTDVAKLRKAGFKVEVASHKVLLQHSQRAGQRRHEGHRN